MSIEDQSVNLKMQLALIDAAGRILSNHQNTAGSILEQELRDYLKCMVRRYHPTAVQERITKQSQDDCQTPPMMIDHM